MISVILYLENPENLAETGIDVIAKPKGKRPTSSYTVEWWRKNIDGNRIVVCNLSYQACSILYTG